MKKFFLIATLVVSANIALAQDKYEFMTVNYETFRNTLYISIDGETLLKEKVDLSKDENTNLNTNPTLKKIKEYQDKGWELVTFETYSYGAGFPAYMAFMKKKKS